MTLLENKENIIEICKELNIQLPEFAITMFENKEFKSKELESMTTKSN